MNTEPDYRDLLEVIGDMIYTIDLTGRFTYVNSAAVMLLGYDRDELVGRHFRDILTDESAAVASKHFAQGIEGTETSPFFEVQAVRKNGQIVDIEIRAGSLFRSRRLIGRQGVARDITMLKDLQHEVATKSQRLALLEDQARTAMDLYRRIADLTLGAPADPEGTERALRHVDDALAHASAEKLGLNADDLRVIELIAAGNSNREIGERIHLSPNTVKDRVRKLMRILGARTRSEVVAQAARRGLVSH